VAADTPDTLRAFRSEYELPYTLLSDPQLVSAEALDTPVSTAKGYYGALALHPSIRHYPRKAFLQPALLIWKGSDLRYEWRQTEKLRNLFGATGRPSGADVVRLVTDALT
jgi:hypothetical protein